MRRLLPATGALLFALMTSSGAWAQQSRGYYGNHMGFGGGFGWFIGPIMMIVFIAVTVVVIVLIVRWLGGPGHWPSSHMHMPTGKTALDILKERYARGEIDKQEFEERRKILGD
jgi:putative membrane protein